MKIDECLAIVAKWGGTLKFFPSEPHARLGIVEEIAEMTTDPDRVRWLVSRVPKLHAEWPGMCEVRAVFCSKFRPADGIEVYSQVYRDGIPSERETAPLALPSGELKQLAAAPPEARATAEDLTDAPSIRNTLAGLAVAKDLNLIDQRAPKVPEIPVFGPNVKPITAADIEREVQRLRDAKGREEAGLEMAK